MSKRLLYRVFVLGWLLKNHYGMGIGMQDYEGSLWETMFLREGVQQDWAKRGIEHAAVTAMALVDPTWNCRALMTIWGIFWTERKEPGASCPTSTSTGYSQGVSITWMRQCFFLGRTELSALVQKENLGDSTQCPLSKGTRSPHWGDDVWVEIWVE